MDLCDAWYALEEKMEEKVKKILQEECPDEPLEELSSFQMLAPFMERNGYINGCGWWVENEDASD
jgi:hypothetical protein